jgi:hypothetical protein
MATDLKYLAYTAVLTATLWTPYIVSQAADVEEQRLGALESAFDCHESSREGERPV